MQDKMQDRATTSVPAQAPAAEVPESTPAPADHAGPVAGMDPITFGLQRLFAAVAEEPVPDEFLSLLDRIEAAEREGREPPGSGDRSSR